MTTALKDIKFLDELVDFLYPRHPYGFKADKMKELLDPGNSGKGRFWEKVVEKGMAGTANLLEANAHGRDMDDNTDMKFALFTTWNSSKGFRKAATIGIENKIGPLRICLCYPGIDSHKVFFMFVPTKAHINRKTNSPVKINWSSETSFPIGDWWDKYRCNFAEVLKPNPEIILPKSNDSIIVQQQLQF